MGLLSVVGCCRDGAVRRGGAVEVSLDGAAVPGLNELECVGWLVYANVWDTDRIVRIDPTDGHVLTTIDASGLLTEEEARTANVLRRQLPRELQRGGRQLHQPGPRPYPWLRVETRLVRPIRFTAR